MEEAEQQRSLGLDRDASFAHDDGTHVFGTNDPIARLFTYPHKTMQLPTVAAGDIIGSFASGAGLEIVLQRLGYAPTLALARRHENFISVPSLSGGPWQPDDADFFTHWHAKEQVLAYIDPCAYFGAFVQAALYKASATASGKIKGSDVYGEVLSKFFNRNIAYLDIRNNYSYSYNLFGLYDDTIRFVSPSDVSTTSDKNFRAAGAWPILRLTIADVPGSKKKSLHRTRLRLPVGKSSAPAVLVSKGFVTTLGPEKPKYKAPAIAADSADPAFYQPIRLAFPLTNDGGQDVFSCSYTRVNIYEKPHAGQPAAGTLDVAGGNYLDGVFRLRDLRLGNYSAGHSFRFEIYPEEVLVDLQGRYGPTYSAAIGIAQDAHNVTLFAFPSYVLPNGHAAKDRQPLPSWADVSSDEAQDFIIKLANTFKYTKITRRTITPAGASTDVDTLIVRHEPSIHHNPATDKNFLEDYCVLVFPPSDHQVLLDQIAADIVADANLPAFLAVAASGADHDAVHDVDYVEVALQSTGFAASGAKAARHATPLTQKVYEYADA